MDLDLNSGSVPPPPTGRGPWEGDFTSLNLSFLLYKMGLTLAAVILLSPVSTMQGELPICGGDQSPCFRLTSSPAPSPRRPHPGLWPGMCRRRAQHLGSSFALETFRWPIVSCPSTATSAQVRFLYFSKPQFPHLEKELNDNSTYLIKRV